MARILLKALGLLLAGAALVGTCFAMWFRLESEDELRMIEQVDMALGAMFALALILLLMPIRLQGARPWVLTAVGAALLWVVVSSSLIWSHREQFRIRSTLPTRMGEVAAAPLVACDPRPAQ